MWENLLRRARIRGLKEGKVQTGRAEGVDGDAKDACERFQDYGFSANPVDGQGLVINVAGVTMVLRMDRLDDRPALGAYEVAVWHRDGHMVKLKAGKVVEVDCDTMVVKATTKVTLDTPLVEATAAIKATTSVQAASVAATTSLKVANKEMSGHAHGGVQRGNGSTDPF